VPVFTLTGSPCTAIPINAYIIEVSKDGGTTFATFASVSSTAPFSQLSITEGTGYWDFSAAITSGTYTLSFAIKDPTNNLQRNFEVSFVAFSLDGANFWDNAGRTASDGLTFMANAVADESISLVSYTTTNSAFTAWSEAIEVANGSAWEPFSNKPWVTVATNKASVSTSASQITASVLSSAPYSIRKVLLYNRP